MERASKYPFRTILIAALASLFAPSAFADSHTDSSATTDQPTVLITGANRGLGLEFARQYAAAGWQVIGSARNPEGASELKALDVRIVKLDVADQGSVDRFAASLGKQPIDMLINNAGIFPRISKIEEIDFDDYSRTLAVNTMGPVRVTRALLPNLRFGAKKTGRIGRTAASRCLGSVVDASEGRRICE